MDEDRGQTKIRFSVFIFYITLNCEQFRRHANSIDSHRLRIGLCERPNVTQTHATSLYFISVFEFDCTIEMSLLVACHRFSGVYITIMRVLFQKRRIPNITNIPNINH